MPTIGQVARELGVRPSTLRYWEARGLVEPRGRTASGYRVYDAADIPALRFIRRAQLFGLTLEEIRELLAIHRRGHRPCRRVRALARQHVRDLRAKIAELEQLKTELESLARRKPGRYAAGAVCPLIEHGASGPRSAGPA